MNSNYPSNIQADFCLEIDYIRESPQPSRVFKTMSSLIDTCIKLDRMLINTIDNNIEPVLLLEDIETGSIKTWLRNMLNYVPDESAMNLSWRPIVGQFLVKGKYALINWLEGKTQITDSKDIIVIENKLYKLAEQTGVRRLPMYSSPKQRELVEGIKDLTQSLSPLIEGDRAKYLTPQGDAIFNLEFNMTPESLEDLISTDATTLEGELILRVKKADYLGDSMWDFVYEDRIIPVKISDTDWLHDFQGNKMEVKPGDFLKSNVKITHNYDESGSLVSTHYEILKVISIIHSQQHNQTNMFE